MARIGLVFKVLLLAAAAGIVVVFAASCGTDSSGSASGQIKSCTYLCMRDPVINWDPAVAAAEEQMVFMNLYETLVRYDSKTQTCVPVIATDYSHSSDGKTWTFHIRKGMKFHDGSVVDAAAVKFSIERVIRINKGNAYVWASVKSIETPDPYTVVFNLKYAAPIDVIASGLFAAYIVSPTAVNAHPENWLSDGHEAGSGPYQLDKWEMGTRIVMKKFPGYWRGWNGNHFDTCIIEKAEESSTRRQMIEGGQADITEDLPFEDYVAMQKNTSLPCAVSAVPSLTNEYIEFNCKKAPTDNAKVRQALCYLFPVDDAVKYAAGGFATATVGMVPSGIYGHSDDILQYTYDLDKAKQLLSEAGYPNGGFTLEALYTAGDDIQRKSLEYYKASLAKVNVTLNIRGGPFPTVWEQSKQANPPQHIFAHIWFPTVMDPFDYLYNLWHSEKVPNFNFSRYSNPKYDKLIDTAERVQAYDRPSAEKMFVDSQRILATDAVGLATVQQKWVTVVNKSFKGFDPNPAYYITVFFYDCYRE